MFGSWPYLEISVNMGNVVGLETHYTFPIKHSPVEKDVNAVRWRTCRKHNVHVVIN